MTWDRSKCDLCGDCLVKCQYVDFAPEGAKEEMRKLIEGEPTISPSDVLPVLPVTNIAKRRPTHLT